MDSCHVEQQIHPVILTTHLPTIHEEESEDLAVTEVSFRRGGPSVLIEGFLDKKKISGSSHSPSFGWRYCRNVKMSRWRRRFVWVNRGSNEIKYRKCRGNKADPLGTLVLNSTPNWSCVRTIEDSDTMFQVVNCNGECYLFRASTPLECKIWTNILDGSTSITPKIDRSQSSFKRKRFRRN